MNCKMRKLFFTIVFYSFFLLVLPSVLAADDLPALNRKVIEYVETVIGEQVDRGECWDLAYQALTRAEAQWDGQYKYGKEVNPRKDEIYPGDIIQFKNVKIRYREGNRIVTESMEHHTAIVYKLLKNGVYKLAHQNTGFSGRTVGISKLDLHTVISGRMWFYRPVSK